MGNAVRHFLRLLKAELEDLVDDINLLEERYRERFAGEEITPYVFQENEALLMRELDSVVKFSRIVDAIDPGLYKGTADLEKGLAEHARQLVGRYEDPEAVFVFIKRKIDKVHLYLATGDGSSGCQ